MIHFPGEIEQNITNFQSKNLFEWSRHFDSYQNAQRL
jgi:hypothetical protein